MNPGLVGQMFLLGSRDQAALAEGKLIVAVYDETPRPAGVAPCKLEGWEFDKEALKNLLTPDDRFGQSYALFLPWPSYGSDVTRIRIAARFEPEQGVAIYAAETKITLTSPQLGADRIPAAPASAPADTPKPGKKKGKKKNAANEQIRQLLQQSEDLRQIQNEWRRFWFNDQPGHLTPERIHGGIQP
jgi:hypothetical protein